MFLFDFPFAASSGLHIAALARQLAFSETEA
jgi:hypothetical protein